MRPVQALLLIRPAAFGFNEETAPSNSFQQSRLRNQEAALEEFDAFARNLSRCEIPVEIFHDTALPLKPDAIFPNNWFSTHENGVIILYPMLAPNRRKEKRTDIIDTLKKRYGYRTVHDLSAFETQGKFLEGTGSLVFDHACNIAYACLSPRTDKDALLESCAFTGCIPFPFRAFDRNQKPIYHTNVVMAIGENIAVLCPDAIAEKERSAVRRMLELSGKTILAVSLPQLESFAGNMLFVKNKTLKNFVILSESAWRSLDNDQQKLLSEHAEPVISPLYTIEKTGGGSARCMIAEVF